MGKKTNNLALRSLTVIFLGLLVLFGYKNKAYRVWSEFPSYLHHAFDNKEELLPYHLMDNRITLSLYKKNELIDFNGLLIGTMGMRGYYGKDGIYISKGEYIVSPRLKASTDYEFNQVKDFADYLKENHIHLLYVNEPDKYLEDNLFRQQFGIESYSNANADRFIDRLKKEEVANLDLREGIVSENKNITSMFYRTDHHWTTQSGLWATKKIAEAMNSYCGYQIDSSIYESKNYNMKTWRNCWLGEQGRKVSKSYIGLDDYTKLTPSFPTSFLFEEMGVKSVKGSFDDFIDETIYDTTIDVYQNDSWHYSYKRKDCINLNEGYGKVLLIGDSYTQVVHPFLALGVHELDSIDLRKQKKDFDLRGFVVENGYDTVIICYAQFMIGAYDQSASSNARMFAFGKE